MSSKKLSWEAHVSAGALLHDLYTKLVQLEGVLGEAYGPPNKPRRLATRTATVILELRAELDRRLSAEFREKEVQARASVYYPGSQAANESDNLASEVVSQTATTIPAKHLCRLSDPGRPLGYSTREEAQDMLDFLVEEGLPRADGGTVAQCAAHGQWHIYLEGSLVPLEAAEVGE